MDKFNTIKLFVYEHKKKIICILALLLVFLVSCIVILKTSKMKNNKTGENLVYENIAFEELESKSTKVSDEEIYYFVDIKGYVNNPGVYSLEKGKRVVDVINKAGGLKTGANTSLLNLSMEIYDAMVIIVYSDSEINNYKQVKEQQQQQAAICKEEIINDACIINSNSQTSNNSLNDTDTNNQQTTDNLNVASEKININTATKEELMTLSKIGESKAIDIIEYRTQNGLFKSIEDIKNVSGIGDSIFESIKDYITI